MPRQNADAVLVDPAWLRERLEDPSVVVVDTRLSEEYGRGHIPRSISWDTYLKYHWADTSPQGMRQFNRLMRFTLGRLGLRRDHTVVFYDEGSVPAGVGYRAIRGVWLLEYFGHPGARLLDGGLRAWEEAGLGLSTEPRRLEPVVFRGRPRPKLVATYQEVLRLIARSDARILDARSPEEHRAENIRSVRGGAVPGAINVGYVKNVDETGRYRPAQELGGMFELAGLRPEHEIVTYCHGSYRAAHSWLALRLAGYPNVRPYLGSWQEWGDRLDVPVEVPK